MYICYIVTSKLKAHLIFWKMSIKSSAGGGLALMFNIPSFGVGPKNKQIIVKNEVHRSLH